ncbi:MAG TPA: arylesterase [Alteromonas australica]|uniref:Arylesterase n=1 Tax=Alteromonas australica TaxID=589873 RepID=A0A350P7Y5_9ALTE|nr:MULTISPECIES: arylesterase [Alteromonas]MAB94007.1 arylesterase [Alteromonas sp.]AJP43514.1 lysophospholipase [Alteromonas australica]MAO28684.1 arylesterase [Alteromonas sp.]MBU34710.1 arylesterase [Alteromonas sp.]QPL48690.1 arylesterase [Alteromonas sp. B31-7]
MFYSLRNIAFVFLLLIPTFAQSDQHDSDEKEPNAKLLILGDSLSAAYGLRQEEGWVSLLQNTWRDENIPIDIVNAAVSGETTDGGLARLPRLLTQHQPSHVLIELGGNDGLQGHNVKKIRSNLVALVKIAQAADAKVFLQDMQIPTNYGKRYTNMFGESFDRVGEELNVPVIPFFLQNIALDTSLMQRDGIHPNAEAQALIAEFMHRQLMPLFDN